MTVEIYTFLVTAFVLAVTPGPSVLYVAAVSLRFGSLAGIVSTLGVNVGSYIVIFAAAFGLYPILQNIPLVIEMIQAVGGCYMIYLAIRMWPSGSASVKGIPNNNHIEYRRMFTQGFITSLLNPKDILFYILFIPTFIQDSDDGESFIYLFITLSCTFAFIGLVTKISFAMFAGKAKKLFASKQASSINYIASLILCILGLSALNKAYHNFM